jgi:hypothetical protein
MLNNLVYTLALTSNGVAEALTLLPTLEDAANNDPHIMDTVAVAYLQASQFGRAEKAIAAVLSRVEAHSPLWFRANLQKAGIMAVRENTEDAAKLLRDILKYSRGASDEDALAASRLLATLDEKQHP